MGRIKVMNPHVKYELVLISFQCFPLPYRIPLELQAATNDLRWFLKIKVFLKWQNDKSIKKNHLWRKIYIENSMATLLGLQPDVTNLTSTMTRLARGKNVLVEAVTSTEKNACGGAVWSVDNCSPKEISQPTETPSTNTRLLQPHIWELVSWGEDRQSACMLDELTDDPPIRNWKLEIWKLSLIVVMARPPMENEKFEKKNHNEYLE